MESTRRPFEKAEQIIHYGKRFLIILIPVSKRVSLNFSPAFSENKEAG